MASTEGAPIPRVYGRARLGGQVIWATNLEEEVVAHATAAAAARAAARRRGTTSRSSTATSPISRSRVPKARSRRSAASGPTARSSTSPRVTYRLHQRQRDAGARQPDRRQGGRGNAPAYRGLAYIVFERLPLADFGNRMPQLSFEIIRAGRRARAACRAPSTLIPGADRVRLRPPTAVTRKSAPAVDVAENVPHRCRRGPTGRSRSTSCRRAARTSSASPSWSPGSAPICAPAPARSSRASTIADKNTEPVDLVGRRA